MFGYGSPSGFHAGAGLTNVMNLFCTCIDTQKTKKEIESSEGIRKMFCLVAPKNQIPSQATSTRFASPHQSPNPH